MYLSHIFQVFTTTNVPESNLLWTTRNFMTWSARLEALCCRLLESIERLLRDVQHREIDVELALIRQPGLVLGVTAEFTTTLASKHGAIRAPLRSYVASWGSLSVDLFLFCPSYLLTRLTNL